MNLTSRLVIFAFAAALTSSAHAVIISYDYEFDTPTYSESWAAPINTALASVGPTITGSLSFDTDNVTSVIGAINYYNNNFTHTNELMSVAGFSAAPGLYVSALDGVTPLNLFYFDQPGSDPSLFLDLRFPASANGAVLSASCSAGSDDNGCGGEDLGSESVSLTNFSLVRSGVPLPATFALLALGFVGLGFNRRKLK